MSKIKVILGTAHDELTPGKCSPDKSIREYQYSRDMCRRIQAILKQKGIDCFIDIEGNREISLQNRCNIVNRYCAQYGSKNCLYVSIHLNAAGNGDWMNARGFSVWVSNNASQNSKIMARIICDNAIKKNLMGNRCIPSTKYWQANFYVLRGTNCPAILTENLFQDNRQDVNFLLSETGKETLANLHVESIMEYIKLKG